MPRHDYSFYNDAESETMRRAMFASIVQPEPAAIVPAVPAVHINREDFERIKTVVRELKELRQALEPCNLNTVIVQGSALRCLLEAAKELEGYE